MPFPLPPNLDKSTEGRHLEVEGWKVTLCCVIYGIIILGIFIATRGFGDKKDVSDLEIPFPIIILILCMVPVLVVSCIKVVNFVKNNMTAVDVEEDARLRRQDKSFLDVQLSDYDMDLVPDGDIRIKIEEEVQRRLEVAQGNEHQVDHVQEEEEEDEEDEEQEEVDEEGVYEEDEEEEEPEEELDVHSSSSSSFRY